MLSDCGVAPILIAGGDSDPNLHALLRELKRQGIAAYDMLVGADSNPHVTWDIDSNKLFLNGEELKLRAAFLRHDVFTQMADPRTATSHRSLSWYSAVLGWLLANPEITLLNRDVLQRLLNKPYILHLAKKVGLEIPFTLVTNDLSRLSQMAMIQPMIAKPINGGGYCQSLEQLLPQTTHVGNVAASPAIVQNQLTQPDVRIYGIGQEFFAFSITSDALDYRTTKNLHIEPMETVSAEALQGLKRLMNALKLDFGAADFKTCPETGNLCFLEINSSPMFVAFDQANHAKITRSILTYLLGHS